MPSLLSGRTRNVLPNVPGWSFASNGVFGNVNGFASVWTQTPAVSVVNSVPRPGRARALTTTTGKTAVGAPVFGSKLGGAPGGGGVGGCVLRGLCGAVLIVDDDVAAAGGAAGRGRRRRRGRCCAARPQTSPRPARVPGPAPGSPAAPAPPAARCASLGRSTRAVLGRSGSKSTRRRRPALERGSRRRARARASRRSTLLCYA